MRKLNSFVTRVFLENTEMVFIVCTFNASGIHIKGFKKIILVLKKFFQLKYFIHKS